MCVCVYVCVCRARPCCLCVLCVVCVCGVCCVCVCCVWCEVEWRGLSFSSATVRRVLRERERGERETGDERRERERWRERRERERETFKHIFNHQKKNYQSFLVVVGVFFCMVLNNLSRVFLLYKARSFKFNSSKTLQFDNLYSSLI